jgi:cytoplasmic iron level regulating protein YaaA (DUF328/UPF0246 family)
MKIVISPAKTLDFDKKYPDKQYTQSSFLKDAENLNNQLKKLHPKDLAALMDISDNLANLNFQRVSEWQLPFTIENAKQAVFAFQGEVYQGLEAEKFSDSELEVAQQRLRILSGLYGVLKPLDLIQPYRLEMGSKLNNNRGKNLYEYWGDVLSQFLNEDLKNDKAKFLINLASNEYFKAINPALLEAKIITPTFKEHKNGELRIISFYAKRARGLMSRFIIKNNINLVEDIKAFDYDRYRFSTNDSDETNWVFIR